MEKIQETPPPQATPTTTITQENEIQPPTKPISQESPKDVCCCCKPATTPDRLKVPKAFKYPERYRSPTDLRMSPVSRGLLARSRKSNGVLPPHRIQPQGPQSMLGVRAEEDTHNDNKLTKEDDVSGLGLLPEAKYDDDKSSREGKNKGSSSSSLSSSISGEHLGLIGREVDRFEDSFNKSDPESPSSECASPLDVSAQTPQWSMISVSPRAGPGQSFSRELLPPNPDWSMSNSPMKSPLPQVMGRSAGYDPNRIPSSIFSAGPTTPMEWSVASNESLFSIHMGNSSFSRDHVFMIGDGKLEEWTNSSSHVQNVSEGKSESNNFVTKLSPVLEAA